MAAYPSQIVCIYLYFECIYPMNDFPLSQLLMSLASKPSSAKTVEHNRSWMLQVSKMTAGTVQCNPSHALPHKPGLGQQAR